jgi:hypothetical protein
VNRLQTWVQALIAIIVTVGFFVVMSWAIHEGFPSAGEGNQGLYILLGTLSTSFGGVLQYYFQTGAKKE